MKLNIIEENRRILEKRAVALAKKEDTSDELLCLEVTSFYLEDECYALETGLIKEVISVGCITPLPCVPPFIAGIINVRGRILSMIDLRRLLGLPGETPDNCRVIILAAEDMEFGLVVDAVDRIVHIPLNDIQVSMTMIEESKRRYFKGITSNRLILLDGDHLLHDPLLVIHDN